MNSPNLNYHSQASLGFDRFDSEVALADALHARNPRDRMFQGVTDAAERQARARIMIVINQLIDEPTGESGETFGAAYARLYGETLTARSRKRRTGT